MQADCGDDGVMDTPITRGWSACRPETEWANCDRQPFRNTIYNFDDVTTSSGTTDPSFVVNALDSLPPNTVRARFSPVSANGVSANSSVSGKFGFSNWGTGANDGETDYSALTGTINASTTKYYEFTIDTVITDFFTVTTINFKVDRDASGPRTFAVRSSRNNFSTNLPVNLNGDATLSVQTGNVVFFVNDATGQTGTITFTASGHTDVYEPVTFRIYGFNAENAAGVFIMDEMVVNGNLGAVENVENYMEYSYCPNAHMFTDGQVARLRAYAETTTNQRSTLWSESNLQNTGIADGYQWQCGPKADFYAVVGTNLNSPTVPFSPTTCMDEDVRFVDNSSQGFPDSWSWSFQDGSPSTSTDQNPEVTFTTPGWKSVTLTVSNANGTNSYTNPYAVLIGGNEPILFGDYYEDFENIANDLNPYTGMNYANNFTYFRKFTGGGHNSGSCAYLNSGDRYPINFIDPTNALDYDELLSPGFDLSYFQSAQFSFWYSYSTATTSIDSVSERLEIYSSTNCGASWQLRANINEEELITNGNLGQGPGTWVQKSISIPGSALDRDIRFKFLYVSSEYSGDLYIDDINISGPVGIEALDAQRLLNVFPNPSNDRFSVQAFGMDTYNTQVTVTDMRGAVIYNKTLAPTGDNGIQISSVELGMANGLYILKVSNEVGTSTQKLTVGK